MNGSFRLRNYIARYRWRLATGGAALLLTTGIGMWIPWLVRGAIDQIQEAGRTGDLANLRAAGHDALWIALLALCGAIVRIYSRLAIFNTGRAIEYDIRSDLFRHLERLPPSYYREQSTGDIMSRAINDLGNVRVFLGPGILNIINTPVVYIFALTAMLSLNWKLTIIAILPYPIMLYAMSQFAKRLYAGQKAVQERIGEISSFVQESFSGIEVVQGFGRENEQDAVMRERSEKYLHSQRTLIAAQSAMMPFMATINGVGTLIVLYVGGLQVMDGALTLGGFVAFNGYLAMLAWPTLAMGWIIAMVQRGRAALGRIADVMHAEPAIRDINVRAELQIRGELEFRGLCIRHGEREVLRDIRLRVPAGSTLAVVGLTGSGKSTLVNAILRLIDVPRGTVFVDGTDIHEIPLQTLRSAVGYAPQQAFMFSRSLERNIGFAPRNLTLDDVQRAARIAHFDADVERFSRGYRTRVGERGVTLSGGQRQRASIARAVAADPRILIFDDSLSAVDSATEKKILDNLRQEAAGRTMIFVSHRMAAARLADQIIVLENGAIIEQGTHDQLMALNGRYAALYRKQRLAEELDELAEGWTPSASVST
ncbi:MAG: putative multidrug resistance ABC transporter ATP-binding/permease protein YheI [Myxococcota bacterium]|nr:putative multidrug resistance ABC transporter ATP-binding/permease protein YheI [Myxococcota bacterium]